MYDLISTRSCPYCLDDNGVGQNSVCNDGFFGVNDGFYECDAIARTEALVNTMAMVKTLKMMLLSFSQSFYV